MGVNPRNASSKTSPEQPLLDGLVVGLRFDDSVPVETIACAAPELSGPNADEYEQISEKVTYRLAQRPSHYVVLKYVRPVLKHRLSETLSCPPAPPRLWDGSMADVSVVAGLLVEKFVYHQPLYRQHQRLGEMASCCHARR